MKQNTREKEIQQVNSGGPDNAKTSGPYHLITNKSLSRNDCRV